jgi:tetratricopeptide (TPR) repeat protein
MRVAALVALCAWAALDQARYVFATDANDLDALSRAASLNPYDTAVLARQERLLIDQERYQEAYDLHRSYRAWRPQDADALVRAGALALQLGKRDEAIAQWQSALKQVPTHPEASRYLAQVWANTAERLDHDNKAVEAANAFRQALTLGQNAGDPAGAGTDWFNYGQFLRRRGAEPRLVMACLLRAEALVKSDDSQLRTVREVREAVEREHPDAAASARKDPSAAVAALQLPVGLESH